MKQVSKVNSRKKFILWGAVAVGATALGRFIPRFRTKPKPAETIRMLGEDGQLVEIDQAMFTRGKKITNLELQHWIKNKPGQ